MYMPKCGECQKAMRMVQREGEFVEVKCRECGSRAFIWDEA